MVTRADSAVTKGQAVADAADVALARTQRTLDIAEISNWRCPPASSREAPACSIGSMC